MKRRRSGGAQEGHQQGVGAQYAAAEPTPPPPHGAQQLCTNQTIVAMVGAMAGATSAAAAPVGSVEHVSAFEVHQTPSVQHDADAEQPAAICFNGSAALEQALVAFDSTLERLRAFRTEHSLNGSAAVALAAISSSFAMVLSDLQRAQQLAAAQQMASNDHASSKQASQLASSSQSVPQSAARKVSGNNAVGQPCSTQQHVQRCPAAAPCRSSCPPTAPRPPRRSREPLMIGVRGGFATLTKPTPEVQSPKF